MRDLLNGPSAMSGDVVNDPASIWHGATIAAAYTREQAIADGALVDLTKYTHYFGLHVGTALTSAAWKEALCEPRADGVPTLFDIGRLLAWLRDIIRAADPTEKIVEAPFTRMDHQPVRLKINCGPGDHREPVLTVMLPSED